MPGPSLYMFYLWNTHELVAHPNNYPQKWWAEAFSSSSEILLSLSLSIKKIISIKITNSYNESKNLTLKSVWKQSVERR